MNHIIITPYYFMGELIYYYTLPMSDKHLEEALKMRPYGVFIPEFGVN
jgi:hypothetical protein